MTAPVSLALALLVSAPSARLDAGVGGEERTRVTDPSSVQSDRVLTDVVITPAVQGQLLFPGSTFLAAYAPRIAWADLGGGEARPQRLDVLHEARLGYQLDRGPIFGLALGAAGALGRSDLVTLRLGQSGAPSTSTVPTVQVIDYRRARGDLTLRLAPDRRSTWTFAAALATDGGATARARLALPEQDTATARLEGVWSATRRDGLGLRLDGTGSRLVATDTRSAFAIGMATWRRQATATALLSAGAGAAWLYSEVLGAAAPQAKETHRRVRPAAEVGLELAPTHGGLSASMDGRLGATIDRVTGAVAQQVDGRVTGRWTVNERWSLQLRGASALSWQAPAPGAIAGRTRTGSVELRNTYAVTPRARLALGGYTSWQRAPPPSPTFVEYGVFMGVGLEAPPLMQ